MCAALACRFEVFDLLSISASVSFRSFLSADACAAEILRRAEGGAASAAAAAAAASAAAAACDAIAMDWPVKVVSPPPARVFTLADLDEYKWFIKATKLHYLLGCDAAHWSLGRRCEKEVRSTLPRSCRGAAAVLCDALPHSLCACVI